MTLYLLGLVTPLVLAALFLVAVWLFERANQWSSCGKCHKEWGHPDKRCFVKWQNARHYWHPLVCEGWGRNFWDRSQTISKARRNFKSNR